MKRRPSPRCPALFEDGFGELKLVIAKVTSTPSERRWQGLSVSEGLVVGRVLRIHRGRSMFTRRGLRLATWNEKSIVFADAIEQAKNQLLVIKERAAELLGQDHAYIFDAHLLLLEDRKFSNQIESYIVRKQANAEWAVKVIGDRLLVVYAEIKDNYLRERGSDIEDVIHRVLEALSGERPAYLDLVGEAVIVSEDLLPSAVAELDLQHARAIVTDAGGWTSHTAIIARGLGIPAIVGLEDLCQHARTGDEIIVDSYKGEVVLHPSSTTLETFHAEVASRAGTRAIEAADGTGVVRTKDGVEVLLRANVELPAEFAGVRKVWRPGHRALSFRVSPGAAGRDAFGREAVPGVLRSSSACR